MSGLGHMASVGDCTIPVGYVMLQLPSKEQQRLGFFCLVLLGFGVSFLFGCLLSFPGSGKSHELFLPASLSARVRACTDGL